MLLLPQRRIIAQASWQIVNIPNLPTNSSLGKVWARSSTEVYVWASRTTPGTTDVPESFLFRWDGTTWTPVLTLSGHHPAGVFGTGASEVFAVANQCSSGFAAGCGPDAGGRIYRSTDGGANWTLQTLPAIATMNDLADISGTPNNVHVIVQRGFIGHIIRFDGTDWRDIYTSSFDDPPYAITLLSPNEGYMVGCWGWGRWDGTTWQWNGRQFDFCDINDCWGVRDDAGALQLYAVGSHNFADGNYVWKFDETNQSFGGKFDTVFGDATGFFPGWASAIWGSAPDDIYVVGQRVSTPGGPRTGRLYHFNGANWSRITVVGEVAIANGVWGTSRNDVWVALNNGQLLHFAPPTTVLDLKMYAGLTITGQAGASYRVEYVPALGSTNNWIALTNLTLPTSPYLFIDLSSPSSSRRFYRAVLTP